MNPFIAQKRERINTQKHSNDTLGYKYLTYYFQWIIGFQLTTEEKTAQFVS
jgi:hypothetical protein